MNKYLIALVLATAANAANAFFIYDECSGYDNPYDRKDCTDKRENEAAKLERDKQRFAQGLPRDTPKLFHDAPIWYYVCKGDGYTIVLLAPNDEDAKVKANGVKGCTKQTPAEGVLVL